MLPAPGTFGLRFYEVKRFDDHGVGEWFKLMKELGLSTMELDSNSPKNVKFYANCNGANIEDASSVTININQVNPQQDTLTVKMTSPQLQLLLWSDSKNVKTMVDLRWFHCSEERYQYVKIHEFNSGYDLYVQLINSSLIQRASAESKGLTKKNLNAFIPLEGIPCELPSSITLHSSTEAQLVLQLRQRLQQTESELSAAQEALREVQRVPVVHESESGLVTPLLIRSRSVDQQSEELNEGKYSEMQSRFATLEGELAKLRKVVQEQGQVLNQNNYNTRPDLYNENKEESDAHESVIRSVSSPANYSSSSLQSQLISESSSSSVSNSSACDINISILGRRVSHDHVPSTQGERAKAVFEYKTQKALEAGVPPPQLLTESEVLTWSRKSIAGKTHDQMWLQLLATSPHEMWLMMQPEPDSESFCTIC